MTFSWVITPVLSACFDSTVMKSCRSCRSAHAPNASGTDTKDGRQQTRTVARRVKPTVFITSLTPGKYDDTTRVRDACAAPLSHFVYHLSNKLQPSNRLPSHVQRNSTYKTMSPRAKPRTCVSTEQRWWLNRGGAKCGGGQKEKE